MTSIFAKFSIHIVNIYKVTSCKTKRTNYSLTFWPMLHRNIHMGSGHLYMCDPCDEGTLRKIASPDKPDMERRGHKIDEQRDACRHTATERT